MLIGLIYSGENRGNTIYVIFCRVIVFFSVTVNLDTQTLGRLRLSGSFLTKPPLSPQLRQFKSFQKLKSVNIFYSWRFDGLLVLTRAGSGGAGLPAAALAAVTSRAALVGHAGGGGPHGRPRGSAIGGAQQPAGRT